MSTRVMLVGLVGGALAAVSGIVALVVGGPDTVNVGGTLAGLGR